MHLRSLKYWIGPAWLDEGRYLAQVGALEAALGQTGVHGTVLNAGCGEGLYAEWLARSSAVEKIFHMDMTAPVMPQLDPKLHQPLAGSITEIPFADGTFDFVLCTEVLEHVPDHELAARELARCVKHGGHVLVSVPHPPAPPDPFHVREGYRLEELRELFAPTGLVVKHHAYALFLPFRLLFYFWCWLYRKVGPYCPRILLRTVAVLDWKLKLGKPWDLVVLLTKP